MAIVVKKDNSSGGGGHVDPTVYKAMVTDVKLIDDPKKAVHGPFLAWSFRVKDPVHDGEPVEGDVVVQGACSVKLTEKSNLNKWLKAMGIEVGDGEEVDVESAVGKVVMVQVVDNERDDMIYSKVKEVMAVPRSKSKSKSEEAEAAPEKEPEPEKPAPESDKQPAEDDTPPPSDDSDGDDDLFDDFDD